MLQYVNQSGVRTSLTDGALGVNTDPEIGYNIKAAGCIRVGTSLSSGGATVAGSCLNATSYSSAANYYIGTDSRLWQTTTSKIAMPSVMVLVCFSVSTQANRDSPPSASTI